MARTEQSGFTLIEVVIVFAITGMLILIAFTGQDAIRQRAQFDSAVNQLVATVAEAKTDAMAGYNNVDTGATSGQGLGGTCPGGHAGDPNVFAGTVWSADSVGGVAVVTIDYYKAETDSVTKNLDGVSCRFDSTSVTVPYQVDVSDGAQPGGRIVFARNDTGNLVVCQITNMGGYPGSATNVFGDPSANCVQPGPLAMKFFDTGGHSADVQIDDSGLARRLN
jgi:prepilin-type N-terminal cleavage/methylation domain-containing protein